MSDDQAARRADPAAGDPEDHPLTGLLRSDAVVLMLARKAIDDYGGGPVGDLAARRVVDGEVRAMIAWPVGADYLRAADDYDRAGRADDAALLRRIAATDLAIEVARTRWNVRYDNRPSTVAQELIDGLRSGGHIDFDPAGPYLGVDGSVYEPGVLALGTEDKPVVLVSGRGSAELVIDWPDYAAMAQWVASRGTTGSGELYEPTASSKSRGSQEDMILARLVSSPRDFALVAGKLAPDAFTSDVRYEVYESVITLAARGQGGTREAIEAELAKRMANVPPYGLVNYGGASASFARTYLGRLLATHVTREAFLSAAEVLIRDDAHDRALAARPTPTSRHVPVVDQRAAADPRLAARQETAISATAAPLHRPPEPPGVVGAPVQRA